MKLYEIHELAHLRGRDDAENFWVIDPAEPEHAREWIRTAEQGRLHSYILPSAFDDFPPSDIDTRTWTTTEMAEYEQGWLSGYLARTTELMRETVAKEDAE